METEPPKKLQVHRPLGRTLVVKMATPKLHHDSDLWGDLQVGGINVNGHGMVKKGLYYGNNVYLEFDTRDLTFDKVGRKELRITINHTWGGGADPEIKMPPFEIEVVKDYASPPSDLDGRLQCHSARSWFGYETLRPEPESSGPDRSFRDVEADRVWDFY